MSSVFRNRVKKTEKTSVKIHTQPTTRFASESSIARKLILSFWRKDMTMDITIGIICFRLLRHYTLYTTLSTEQDYPIHCFQIWQGELPEDHVLYLINPDDSSPTPIHQKYWKGKSRILFTPATQKEPELPKNQGNIIALPKSLLDTNNSSRFMAPLFSLVNHLQEIFQEFHGWYNRTQLLCQQRKDFSEILNELEQTYDLISILVDKNLRYISISDSYYIYNSWMGEAATMPIELVNELMMDEHFRAAIEHNHAFHYYTDAVTGDGGHSYCFNIKPHGIYEARILIQPKNQQPFFGGLALVSCLGNCLLQIFEGQKDEQNQELGIYDFYDMIWELIHNNLKNPREIRQKLHIRGWIQEHRYQVYIFQFIEKANATVTRQYYQTTLERHFANCCVLPDGQQLICIRNLSLTPEKNWDMRQELSLFLRENLCKAGISQQFTDLTLLHNHFIEAKQALLIGEQSKSTWWYYPFETIILPYIWNKATTELDRSHLYHPAIRILLAYDQKEHTDMVKTVYTYMNCRYNVTQAAKELYIHRTTMLFRLERIQILTGIDWDSWNERLHLAVSFELMKMG